MTDAPDTLHEADGRQADPQAILETVFGFKAFRPGQEAVVRRLLAGEHVMALVPTGGGKSLTYQLASLVRPGLGLVVSPLRALMQDQVRQLTALGIAAATVQSGTTFVEKRRVWQAIRDGSLDLLYVSPELLLKEGGRLLAALAKVPLALVAVDEAHTVSQWGQGFRQVYRELAVLRHRLPGVPIVALTATADEATLRDVMDVLFGGPVALVRQSFDRENLQLQVLERHRPEAQIAGLVEARRGQAGIVYVRTRNQAEATAAALRTAGHDAMPYHAGMADDDRLAVMERFVTDAAPLVVATIAFGMGIDRPDVRFVIHRDLPDSPEAYYQEIGRGGRDGLLAEAILLFGLDDLPKRRRMIEQGEASAEFKRLQHRRLDALLGVVEARSCRKQALLRYFGEEAPPCGRCDICLDPPELTDVTEQAILLLKAIVGCGQSFGRSHVLDVLAGADTEKIRRCGHDRLPVWGAGKGLDRRAWQALVRQMYAAGHLEIDLERHGILTLRASAHEVLDGSRRVAADLRVRRETARARSPSGAAAAALEGPEADLFQRLRQLRLRLAKESGRAPFMIFNDRTLQDMARRQPADLDGLREVQGVGEVKLGQFGRLFLDEIGAWREETREAR